MAAKRGTRWMGICLAIWMTDRKYMAGKYFSHHTRYSSRLCGRHSDIVKGSRTYHQERLALIHKLTGKRAWQS